MASTRVELYKQQLIRDGFDPNQYTDEQLTAFLGQHYEGQGYSGAEIAQNFGSDFSNEYLDLKNRPDPDQSYFDEFTSGVRSSSYGLASTGVGALGLGAGAVGLDGAEEFLMDKSAGLSQEASKDRPTIDRASDVRWSNPAEVARYLSGGFGEALPSVAESALAFAGGGGVGYALAKKKAKDALRKTIKNRVEGSAGDQAELLLKEMVRQQARQGAVTGSMASTGISSLGLGMGEIYSELYPNTKLPETSPDYIEPSRARSIAMGFGAVSGGLDFVGAATLLGKLTGATGEVAQSYLRRLMLGLPEGVFVEGGTEAMQEFINVAAEKYAKGMEIELNGQELDRLFDAGVLGALGGVQFTAIGALKGPPKEADNFDDSTPVAEDLTKIKQQNLLEDLQKNSDQQDLNFEVGDDVQIALGESGVVHDIVGNSIVVKLADGTLKSGVDPRSLSHKIDIPEAKEEETREEVDLPSNTKTAVTESGRKVTKISPEATIEVDINGNKVTAEESVAKDAQALFLKMQEFATKGMMSQNTSTANRAGGWASNNQRELKYELGKDSKLLTKDTVLLLRRAGVLNQSNEWILGTAIDDRFQKEQESLLVKSRKRKISESGWIKSDGVTEARVRGTNVSGVIESITDMGKVVINGQEYEPRSLISVTKPRSKKVNKPEDTKVPTSEIEQESQEVEEESRTLFVRQVAEDGQVSYETKEGFNFSPDTKVRLLWKQGKDGSGRVSPSTPSAFLKASSFEELADSIRSFVELKKKRMPDFMKARVFGVEIDGVAYDVTIDENKDFDIAGLKVSPVDPAVLENQKGNLPALLSAIIDPSLDDGLLTGSKFSGKELTENVTDNKALIVLRQGRIDDPKYREGSIRVVSVKNAKYLKKSVTKAYNSEVGDYVRFNGEPGKGKQASTYSGWEIVGKLNATSQVGNVDLYFESLEELQSREDLQKAIDQGLATKDETKKFAEGKKAEERIDEINQSSELSKDQEREVRTEQKKADKATGKGTDYEARLKRFKDVEQEILDDDSIPANEKDDAIAIARNNIIGGAKNSEMGGSATRQSQQFETGGSFDKALGETEGGDIADVYNEALDDSSGSGMSEDAVITNEEIEFSIGDEESLESTDTAVTGRGLVKFANLNPKADGVLDLFVGTTSPFKDQFLKLLSDYVDIKTGAREDDDVFRNSIDRFLQDFYDAYAGVHFSREKKGNQETDFIDMGEIGMARLNEMHDKLIQIFQVAEIGNVNKQDRRYRDNAIKLAKELVERVADSYSIFDKIIIAEGHPSGTAGNNAFMAFAMDVFGNADSRVNTTKLSLEEIIDIFADKMDGTINKDTFRETLLEVFDVKEVNEQDKSPEYRNLRNYLKNFFNPSVVLEVQKETEDVGLPQGKRYHDPLEEGKINRGQQRIDNLLDPTTGEVTKDQVIVVSEETNKASVDNARQAKQSYMAPEENPLNTHPELIEEGRTAMNTFAPSGMGVSFKLTTALNQIKASNPQMASIANIARLLGNKTLQGFDIEFMAWEDFRPYASPAKGILNKAVIIHEDKKIIISDAFNNSTKHSAMDMLMADILHEAVHAVTRPALDLGYAYSSGKKRLIEEMIQKHGLPDEFNLSGEALGKIWSDFNDKLLPYLREKGKQDLDLLYGLSSIDEFFSELSSDRKFMEFLDSVEMPKDMLPPKSALRTVLDFVLNLLAKLGFKTARTDTALTYARQEMRKLMDISNQTSELSERITALNLRQITTLASRFDTNNLKLDYHGILERISQETTRNGTGGNLEDAARYFAGLPAPSPEVTKGPRNPLDATESRITGFKDSRYDYKNIKEYAEENGLLVTDFLTKWEEQQKTDNRVPSGSESDVYLDEDAQRVVKRNNLAIHNGDILAYLNRLIIHNYLFPTTAYKLEGFAPYKLMDSYDTGKTSVVVSQPFIMGVESTDQEIRRHLTNMGLNPRFGISSIPLGTDVNMSDVRPGNAYTDEQGNVHVVDPIIEQESSMIKIIERKLDDPDIDPQEGLDLIYELYNIPGYVPGVEIPALKRSFEDELGISSQESGLNALMSAMMDDKTVQGSQFSGPPAGKPDLGPPKNLPVGDVLVETVKLMPDGLKSPAKLTRVLEALHRDLIKLTDQDPFERVYLGEGVFKTHQEATDITSEFDFDYYLQLTSVLIDEVKRDPTVANTRVFFSDNAGGVGSYSAFKNTFADLANLEDNQNTKNRQKGDTGTLVMNRIFIDDYAKNKISSFTVDQFIKTFLHESIHAVGNEFLAMFDDAAQERAKKSNEEIKVYGELRKPNGEETDIQTVLTEIATSITAPQFFIDTSFLNVWKDKVIPFEKNKAVTERSKERVKAIENYLVLYEDIVSMYNNGDLDFGYYLLSPMEMLTEGITSREVQEVLSKITLTPEQQKKYGNLFKKSLGFPMAENFFDLLISAIKRLLGVDPRNTMLEGVIRAQGIINNPLPQLPTGVSPDFTGLDVVTGRTVQGNKFATPNDSPRPNNARPDDNARIMSEANAAGFNELVNELVKVYREVGEELGIKLEDFLDEYGRPGSKKLSDIKKILDKELSQHNKSSEGISIDSAGLNRVARSFGVRKAIANLEAVREKARKNKSRATLISEEIEQEIIEGRNMYADLLKGRFPPRDKIGERAKIRLQSTKFEVLEEYVRALPNAGLSQDNLNDIKNITTEQLLDIMDVVAEQRDDIDGLPKAEFNEKLETIRDSRLDIIQGNTLQQKTRRYAVLRTIKESKDSMSLLRLSKNMIGTQEERFREAANAIARADSVTLVDGVDIDFPGVMNTPLKNFARLKKFEIENNNKLRREQRRSEIYEQINTSLEDRSVRLRMALGELQPLSVHDGVTLLVAKKVNGQWEKDSYEVKIKNGKFVDREGFSKANKDTLMFVRDDEMISKHGHEPWFEIMREQALMALNEPIMEEQFHVQRAAWYAGLQGLTDRFAKLGYAGKKLSQMSTRTVALYRDYATTSQSYAKQFNASLHRVMGKLELGGNEIYTGLYQDIFWWFDNHPEYAGDEEKGFRELWKYLKSNANVPDRSLMDDDAKRLIMDMVNKAITARNWEAEVNKRLGNRVKDEEIKVESFINQEMVDFYRLPMEMGYATMPRTLNNGYLMDTNRIMEEAKWHGEDVKGILNEASKVKDPEEMQRIYSTLFNDQIVDRFVKPFTNTDVRQSVFRGPKDNEGDNMPMGNSFVSTAFEASNGDMYEMANYIFDQLSEDQTEQARAEWQYNFLGQFFKRYRQIQRVANRVGNEKHGMHAGESMRHTPQSLDARMVESRLPKEFFYYNMYDEVSSNIRLALQVATSQFGRNGDEANIAYLDGKKTLSVGAERFNNLMSTATNSMHNKPQRVYSRAVKRKAFAILRDQGESNPEKVWNELYNQSIALGEIQVAFDHLGRYYGKSNVAGPYQDANLLMDILGVQSVAVLNNPKSSMMQALSLFEFPNAFRGLNRLAGKGTASALGNFINQTFGGMLEAMGVELEKTGRYAQYLNNTHYRMDEMDLSFKEYNTIVGSGGDLAQSIRESPGLGIKGMVRKLNNIASHHRRYNKDGTRAPIDPLSLVTGIFPYINNVVNHSVGVGAIHAYSDLVLQMAEVIESRGLTEYTEITAEDLGMGNSMGEWIAGEKDGFDRANEMLIGAGAPSVSRLAFDYVDRKKSDKDAMPIDRNMALLINQVAMNQVSGEGFNSKPSNLYNNDFLKYFATFLGWPLGKMSRDLQQIFRDPSDRVATMQALMKYIGMMSVVYAPVGLSFAMLIDWYDDEMLEKPNNLPPISPWAALPVLGPFIAMDDPNFSVYSITSRLAKAGVPFGMGMDLANGLFAKGDPYGAAREISLDSRIFAWSMFKNIYDAMGTWAIAGEFDWQLIGRPIVYGVGGNSVIQMMDLTTATLDIDSEERRVADYIAMRNNIKKTAFLMGLPLKAPRKGGGTQSGVSINTRQMARAAFAGDNEDFLEQYQEAVESAREYLQEKGRDDDPEKYVADRFKERDIRFGITDGRISDADFENILAILEPDERQKIVSAIQAHEHYLMLIGGTPRVSREQKNMNRYEEARKIAATLLR